ncbi:hypothetical protein D3C76_1409150 [compost metagenome]
MTPTQAMPTFTLSVDTMVGNEAGRIAFTNTSRRDPPNVRMTLTRLASTSLKLLKTTNVVTITVIDSVVTTMAVNPAPNNTINIGPSATFGMLLNTTM